MMRNSDPKDAALALALSQDEAQRAGRALGYAQQKIARLEAEVKRLRSAISRLEAENADLMEQLRLCGVMG